MVKLTGRVHLAVRDGGDDIALGLLSTLADSVVPVTWSFAISSAFLIDLTFNFEKYVKRWCQRAAWSRQD